MEDYKSLYEDAKNKYKVLKKNSLLKKKVFLGGNSTSENVSENVSDRTIINQEGEELIIEIYKKRYPVLTPQNIIVLQNSYSKEPGQNNTRSCFYNQTKQNITDINQMFSPYSHNVVVYNNKREILGMMTINEENNLLSIWNVCRLNTDKNHKIPNVMRRVIRSILKEYSDYQFKLRVYLMNEKAAKLYEDLGFRDLENTENSEWKEMIRESENSLKKNEFKITGLIL